MQLLFHSHNYRPQRSCGQGNVFTGVCLSTGEGGCLPQCMLGCHTPPGTRQTPRWRTPPGPGRPPQDQADPPGWRNCPPPGPGRPPQMENSPGTRQTPPWDGEPPLGSRPQHTVYERPVRILLECILVCSKTTHTLFQRLLIP